MRKIHGFYAIFLSALLTPPALLAQATQSAPATPVPTPPVISGIVTTSSYTISGTAEKSNGPNHYKKIAIYVCSTPTKPGAKPTDCSVSVTGSDVTAAALTNSEPVAPGTANYVLADKNGSFAAILPDNLKNGLYVYITEVATNVAGAKISSFSNAATVISATTQCNIHPATDRFSDCDFDFSFIGGVEQSAQSASPSETTPFFRVFTRATPRAHTYTYFWATVRLLGAPTTSSTQGVVSVVADPSGALTTQTFSTIGTSIDYMVGAEYRLTKNKMIPYSISLITGFGATTPLQANTLSLAFTAPAFGTVECNQIFPRFKTQFALDNIIQGNANNTTTPNTPSCLMNANSPTSNGATTYTPITTIGFSNQDRTSFLLKDAFGARTIYRYRGAGNVACGDSDSANHIGPCQRGVVDWTFGQDASITGGQMRKWIFKVDAVYPLAIANLQFLYLFGSASIRLEKNIDYAPLILQPANIATLAGSGTGGVPNTSVVVLSLVQPNRDIYRFGAGINITQLFAKLFSSASANSSTPAASSQ